MTLGAVLDLRNKKRELTSYFIATKSILYFENCLNLISFIYIISYMIIYFEIYI